MILYCGFWFVFLGLAKSSLGEYEVVMVGKPELQCGENGTIIEIKSETTKIRLPVNAHALFSVNTERTSICVDNQHCVLMTWKILREFEMYLNNNFENTGTNGVIQFENDMIIPGFNYLLHITLKEAGGKIAEKDYNLTFSQDRDSENAAKVLGNLDLNIGTRRLYSSLPIVINANATLCGDINYYYYKWSTIINNQEVVLPEKSTELLVFPSTILTDNEGTCIIHCSVMETDNIFSVLEGSISIDIIDKPKEVNDDIQVFLPFRYTTISIGAPIIILPYIYTPRNKNYKIEWVCLFDNTLLYGCQGQINVEFYMETGFNLEGDYSITLIVRTDNSEKSATCNILVLPDVPSIEFDLAHPIKPELGIQISAKIYELRTYCTVQWFGNQDNQFKLDEIPGLTTEIYNISSKDKSFLEEMVDFGRITVTREFKLRIPSPSRTWAGLESKHYQVKLAVTCPSLKEIVDRSVVKDHPEDFITITGQTDFFVPSSPTVEALDVVSESNTAMLSEYYYIVQEDTKNDSPMLYKYGFILEGIEVVFYTGIDMFSAKTVLPYNGDLGIDTYVEVCDYNDRCGKKFGPVIKPDINNNLDETDILRTLKQKLIEENFYKVFSYAFMVLHSANFVGESQKYSSLFSTEISTKVQQLLEHEENEYAVQNFIKNLVIFVDHLQLSDELKIQLSELTHQFITNTISQKRIARDTFSKALSNPEEDLKKLEELQNYLKTSDYLILNSMNGKAVNREKDHMINLLDGWMVLACSMLFKGQRVPKVEMKTMVFAIEKLSQQNVDKFITVPFDNNAWNVTTHLKINKHIPQKNLCIGHVMLKHFFSKQEVTFGANLYSGETEQTPINVSAEIRILLPKLETSHASQCSVYNNGWILHCSSSKNYVNFVECTCPTFGYYFLDASNSTSEKWNKENLTFTENSTKVDDEYNNVIDENTRRLGETISYVIIVSSLVGFLILCYIIRKLSIYPQHNVALDGFNEHEYGHIMYDDNLN